MTLHYLLLLERENLEIRCDLGHGSYDLYEKDIFIDSKIGLEHRDSWPIVVDATGKIVWIPGIKKSKYDVKKVDSYDIVLKYS